MDEKTCKKCGQTKPANSDNFAKGRGGFHAWCKPCMSAYNRERHAEKVKARMLGA